MIDIEYIRSFFPPTIARDSRFDRYMLKEYLQLLILDHLATTPYINKVSFIGGHFADAKKDGSNSTVCQQETYQNMLQHLADMLQTDYALESDLHSQRFPLTKNNLGYRLRKENIICNTFVVRPSCDIINFDNRRLLIAYRMADLISKELDAARGIRPEDSADFKDTCFGYKDIKIEK